MGFGWTVGGRRGLTIPAVCFQAAEHLVGQADGPKGLFAADPGSGQAAGGSDEVCQLESQGLQRLLRRP